MFIRLYKCEGGISKKDTQMCNMCVDDCKFWLGTERVMDLG